MKQNLAVFLTAVSIRPEQLIAALYPVAIIIIIRKVPSLYDVFFYTVTVAGTGEGRSFGAKRDAQK
jgi:hypothetical protein